MEWPKPNHFHAEPPMIGRDSVRSCLDFYHKCARQWAGSHLDPKQGNDGQDGRRIANRGDLVRFLGTGFWGILTRGGAGGFKCVIPETKYCKIQSLFGY